MLHKVFVIIFVYQTLSLPTAISSGPKLLSQPFQTNDITWAQTSDPVSGG